MKTIRLHGEMGKRFGMEHRLDVGTPAEALRALCSQVKGFKSYLYARADRRVSIFCGLRNIGEADIGFRHPEEIIRIVPIVEGAGGGKGTNWLMIIIGVILVWWSSGTSEGGWKLIAAGVGMSLIGAGVSGLLAKTPPKLRNTYEEANVRQSYAFSGPVNTTAQGNPVPVCYGRMLVGSQAVSLGLVTL